MTEVAIIGAGPYGLSVAAHLRLGGLDVRIFGHPMESWKRNMPEGMFLKSEGCASNLSCPGNGYTLRDYCAAQAVPYAQYAKPVSIEVFTCYGLAFQRRFVPFVERTAVTALDKSSSKFELTLETGEKVRANKVVVATGLAHCAYIPPELAHLPSDLLSHSSRHRSLNEFDGREVTVIGGGQSALETAALLHEAGAQVRVLVRSSVVRWNEKPSPERRSLYQRLRRPMSGLGPGFGPWFYSNAPVLFRQLPRRVRVTRVKLALGPAGAAWLRERVEGRLPLLPGHSVRTAEASGDRVLLQLESPDGKSSQLSSDHIIAATGYRFNLSALPFLSAQLLSQLSSADQKPILSPHLESAVPGLYFTGLATATQFGPAMRFLFGAEFTARRISRHIAGRRLKPCTAASCSG